MSRRPSTKRTYTDLEVLDVFVELADDLGRTRLVQQGFETSLVIRGGGKPSLVVQSPEPDEDDFRSMLLALRQLIAEGSETQMNRIYNLIEAHVSDPALVQDARDSRSIMSAAAAGASGATSRDPSLSPGLSIDGLNPGEIADRYLNGQYFHHDANDADAIRRLSPEESVLHRYFLRQYAVEAIRQVAAASNIVRKAKADGTLA
jgi:hypothetical protein